MFSLDHRAAGDVEVIEVAGDLDVYTCPLLRDLVADLTDTGRWHLVIDLASTEYMDMTGFGVLVGALRRVRVHDGRLAIASAPERIAVVFRITGLAKVFANYATVAEALDAMKEDGRGG